MILKLQPSFFLKLIYLRTSISSLEYTVGPRLIRWPLRLGALFAVEGFPAGKDALSSSSKKAPYPRGGGLLYSPALFRGGRGFTPEDADSFFFISSALLEL